MDSTLKTKITTNHAWSDVAKPQVQRRDDKVEQHSILSASQGCNLFGRVNANFKEGGFSGKKGSLTDVKGLYLHEKVKG